MCTQLNTHGDAYIYIHLHPYVIFPYVIQENNEHQFYGAVIDKNMSSVDTIQLLESHEGMYAHTYAQIHT